jgi:putative membrane protein
MYAVVLLYLYPYYIIIMKDLRVIIIALLATCTLLACHHSSSQLSSGDDEDSITASTDTSSTLNLAVDKSDSDFAVDAANGNCTEVELGKLAVKNGKSAKVKNFGVMMVKDHGKANAKLMMLSKAKNLNLSSTPNADGQKMIDDLSKKTGDEFDKAYISSMIADHREDVQKFGDATNRLQDPDLKNYAIKTLPVLQKHLDAINAIHDSMSH